MVPFGQTHGAKEETDSDLAGIVVDKFELASFTYPIECTARDFEGRRDQMLDALARECGLAERTQAIVARRVGSP